jgi:hypothetical protein
VRPSIAYTVRRFHHTFNTGKHCMLTIHIVQARLGYGVDYMKFADQEGLVLYLLTRGVTDDHILKALDGLERHGAYTIQQASSTPGAAGVV